MAAEMKKRRLSHLEKDYNKRHWLSTIANLITNNCSSQVTLTPLKILNCNATTSRGSPFSKAYCDTEYFDDGAVVFGDVFQTGMDILVDYFINNTLPNGREFSIIVEKLLDFMNGDRSVNTIDPQRMQALTETELIIMAANHLFGKLATSSYYLVNKTCTSTNEEKCFCGDESCKMTGHYGETSIGNAEVWHGDLNIVINNDLPIEPLKDASGSPDGKPATDLKAKAALKGSEQMIAKTIVFSFLQKRTHPEWEHFLVPCIGIGSSDLLVMLYDSENDVLLESSCVPLFKDPYSGEFSYAAILVSWLTLNYKFLCTGLPNNKTENKSEFFMHAKSKIHVYKEKLFFGSISKTQVSKQKIKLCSPAKSSKSMNELEKKIMETLGKI